MKGRGKAGRGETTLEEEGGDSKYIEYTEPCTQVYSFLAFRLCDLHRVGSMMQGDTTPLN